MRNLLLIVFMVCAPLALFADEPGCKSKEEWREYVYAQKRVFFNEHIKFTQTEAAAFWSLYDRLSADLRRSHRNVRAAMKAGDDASADYGEIVRRINAEENVQDSLHSAFRVELGKILPAEKIYRYMKAEDAFKQLLIKDVDSKERKGKK